MRNSRRAGAMGPPLVDKFLSEASPVDLETAQDRSGSRHAVSKSALHHAVATGS